MKICVCRFLYKSFAPAVQPSAGGIRERSYLAVGTTTPAGSASTRLEITPLLSGERDWQAAVLRVVPVREECHAATRM